MTVASSRRQECPPQPVCNHLEVTNIVPEGWRAAFGISGQMVGFRHFSGLVVGSAEEAWEYDASREEKLTNVRTPLKDITADVCPSIAFVTPGKKAVGGGSEDPLEILSSESSTILGEDLEEDSDDLEEENGEFEDREEENGEKDEEYAEKMAVLGPESSGDCFVYYGSGTPPASVPKRKKAL